MFIKSPCWVLGVKGETPRCVYSRPAHSNGSLLFRCLRKEGCVMREKEKVGGYGARMMADFKPSCETHIISIFYGAGEGEHKHPTLWHRRGREDGSMCNWARETVEMVGGCGQSLAMDLNSGQLSAILLRATNFWLILQTKLAIFPPILAPISTSSTTVFLFFFFPSLASYLASAQVLANFLFNCQQKLCMICTNQSFLTLTLFSLPI